MTHFNVEFSGGYISARGCKKVTDRQTFDSSGVNRIHKFRDAYHIPECPLGDLCVMITSR